MGQRELIEPHKGDKRYQGATRTGHSASPTIRAARWARTSASRATKKKPRGEGDKGD